MGSLNPPWADELMARKTKLSKMMKSSMSTESYFEEPPFEHVQGQRNTPSPGPPNRTLSSDSDHGSSISSSSPPSNHLISATNGESNRKVVDLSLNLPPANTNARMKMASSQSVDSPTTCSSTSSSLPSPSSGSASSRARRQQQPHHGKTTEKSSPIRNESFVDEEDEGNKKSFEMTNGGEDLSILEYGPGIVKKLRSRYQSLALRQYSARPTLRRSASLENCLDAVSAEELAATLESKISNHDGNGFAEERNEGSNGRQTRGRNRFLNGSSGETDSRTGSPVPVTATNEQQQQQKNNEQSGKLTRGSGEATPRGRASGMDASARRDRMRRARSVDALHRTKREEEILEKFKHVVLPKEEIVIIEVSKPLPQEGSVIGSAAVFNQAENNLGGATNGERRFPTRLLLTSNNLKNSSAAASILDQNSVRNLMISPEHELPPHDIVRETARIFERNQENLNRRIGQALRLTKSQSVSSDVGSSPPLVPPSSPTPSNTSNNTSTQKSVMAQSPTTTSPTSAASGGAMQPSQDKSFPTKTKVVEANNVTVHANNAMANGPSHGQKQIGIIKPTLNNTTTSNGVINFNGKLSNGVGVGSASAGSENRVRSPILSPIGLVSNHKPLIQNAHKPPLSPKPIFTSSPKVSLPGAGLGGAKGKPLTRDSPTSSPSPILIIDNRDRSVSPFKSDSPIPRVGGDNIGRVKSPVSAKTPETPPDSLEERREVFLRSPSPAKSNGQISPINGEVTTNPKRLESPVNQPVKTNPKVSEEKEPPQREFVVLKHVQSPNVPNGQQHVNSTDHRQQITKEPIQPPPPARGPSPTSAPVTTTPVENPNPGHNPNSKVSQLRVHQKQKSSQGGNGSMVFNFTTRKAVPDYIEDDGIRRDARTAGDGRMDSMEDGFPSLDKDTVDSKIAIPIVEGGNVIINGKSSIQKRPKSQKLSISFNESATTTHEYPSETSLLVEEEPSENDNYSSKKPNVISGSSLGSYTPKQGSNAYQLGSYNPFDSSPGPVNKKSAKGEEGENDFIEDYLKPNTESTTWSNEMTTSDILF